MTKKRFLFYSIFVLLPVLNSCEHDRDMVVDSSLSPPFLTALSIDNTSLNLDTTTSAAIVRLPDMKFKISGRIAAHATDPDGSQDINQVTYNIYQPKSSNAITHGLLTRTDTSYVGSFSFVIDRADIGVYRVEILANDRSGFTSNSLEVPLLLTRNNSIPQASNPVAPDTLQRPSSGFSPPIIFSLTVSDSDGYGDIEKVFFKRISPPGGTNELFDDGDQVSHGDQLAGDGVFSLKVQIGSNAILGDQVFLFQAQDKSGALSDSLFRTVTIIP